MATAMNCLWVHGFAVLLTACSSSENCIESCTSTASVDVTHRSGDFVAANTVVVIEGVVDGAATRNRCLLGKDVGACERSDALLTVGATKVTDDRVTALAVFPKRGAIHVTFQVTTTAGEVIVPTASASLTYDEERVSSSCSCTRGHAKVVVP